MKIVNVNEFKTDLEQGVELDRNNGSERILYTRKSGERCLFDADVVEILEDSLVISSGDETFAISDPYFGARQEEAEFRRKEAEEKAKEEAKAEKINAGCGVITVIIVLLLSWYGIKSKGCSGNNFHQVDRKTVERIKEIDAVRESLGELDKYLSVQREEIKDAERIVRELQSKKTQTEELLQLSSEQVQAIQKSLDNHRERARWFDYLWGFLIGIAFSAVVHFWAKWSSRRG